MSKVALSQRSQQFACSVKLMMQQTALNFQLQVQYSLSDFQRSMKVVLETNGRNGLQIEHSLSLIDERIKHLESALVTERDRYQTCLGQAELSYAFSFCQMNVINLNSLTYLLFCRRTRLMEDMCGLNMRWQQIHATCDAITRSASASEAVIFDHVTQFGHCVWKSAIQQTSNTLNQLLGNSQPL